MSNFKAIKIEGTEGTSLCESCGYYYWGTYVVKFPDGSEMEYDWDDHMGGGSREELNVKILEHLGYVIEENVDWKSEEDDS